MSIVQPTRRVLGIGLAALVLTVGAAACSSGGPGSANGPYMVWDPYPQLGSGSVWAQTLDKCANKAGASITRTSYPASDIVGKEKTAAYQGLSPDLLIAADSDVPALVSGQLLASAAQTHLPTSGVEPGVLAAGQVKGATYGDPIGANTIALYYNKSILAQAGVNVASITDWASLTSALSKVKSSGKTGITFAAAASQDGSAQFEPWLWGAGASLTSLSAPGAVSALSLWTTWRDHGYVSASVASDTDALSWREFAAGSTAFDEGSSGHAEAAAKLAFPYGVIAIPSESGGGAAPAPLEGESITIPVQTDTSRYAIDDEIVSCLAGVANAVAVDNELSEVGVSSSVQSKQVVATPALSSWVAMVNAAKSPTGDGVGDKYEHLSTQLWTAVHTALTGAVTPQEALAAAQKASG